MGLFLGIVDLLGARGPNMLTLVLDLSESDRFQPGSLSLVFSFSECEFVASPRQWRRLDLRWLRWFQLVSVAIPRVISLPLQLKLFPSFLRVHSISSNRRSDSLILDGPDLRLSLGTPCPWFLLHLLILTR